MTQSSGLRARLRNVVLVVALASSSCAIRLVSSYDETTDKTVSALQRKTESHLLALERLDGQPDCVYAKQKTFYDEAKVEVSAISVRAAAIPHNEVTTEQTALLANSLESLERLHQLGCLSKEQIKPLRVQFNSSYTAILKLELAKKRGD